MQFVGRVREGDLTPQAKISSQDEMGELAQHLDQMVAGLEAEGFTQVVQLLFPASSDALFNASWPFGEMTFHLFSRKIKQVLAFRYLWS